MRKVSVFIVALSLLIGMTSPIWAQDVGAIKKGVQNTLNAHYGTARRNISVEPSGKVTLKGSVPSYYDKVRHQQLTSRVAGVTSISNQLVVKTDSVPDAMIASRIESALKLNGAINEPHRIVVSVDKGTVILSGSAHSYRESMIAVDVASWGKGVLSVGNQIKVLQSAQALSDENIATVIADIRSRRFPLQKGVNVKVMKGKVTLTGMTTSLWAKNELPKAIRRIQGVTSVDNQLTVKVNK